MKFKKKYVLYIVIGVIVLALTIFPRVESTPQNQDTTQTPISHGSSSNYIIEIKGEVIKPGVYQISSDTRLYEMIQIAGGLTKDAETEFLNLAQNLYDGQSIVIPKKQEEQKETSTTSKISINQASAVELTQLTGIGDARANAIIAYRNIHGGFSRLEDIMKVSGISESIFNQIKDDIRL